MKVKNIDHLNLTVKNFTESADWYKRVFGFSTVEQGSYETAHGKRIWGILRSGEALLCLYEHPHRTFLDNDTLANKGIHGLYHFSLRITDRAEWEHSLARENISVGYGGAFRYPHSTSWYINDPTGYGIEVVLWDNDTITFA